MGRKLYCMANLFEFYKNFVFTAKMAKKRKENGPLQLRKTYNPTQRSGLYQLEKNLQL